MVYITIISHELSAEITVAGELSFEKEKLVASYCCQYSMKKTNGTLMADSY